MSISPVASSAVSSSATSAAEAAAKAQLVRDQKKLEADTKAKASQQQLQADMMAITNDEVAIAEAASSRVATTL